MALFTLADIGDAHPTDNVYVFAYDVNNGCTVAGRAYANAHAIGVTLGEERVKEWIVHCLNKVAQDRGYKVVCADLIRGVQIDDPVSSNELEPWDRLR